MTLSTMTLSTMVLSTMILRIMILAISNSQHKRPDSINTVNLMTQNSNDTLDINTQQNGNMHKGHQYNGSKINVIPIVASGNTKVGSITVPLTSCLTGLDFQSVLQIKTKIVCCHSADSKPVKQEVNGTVILPPLVFPGCILFSLSLC